MQRITFSIIIVLVMPLITFELAFGIIEQKIDASDGAAYDTFGISVSAVDPKNWTSG